MTNARPLTDICRRNGKTLTWLARAISRPRNTVKKWGAEVRVPAEAVPGIVRALNGAVSASDLRPDIFGTTSPTERAR